MQALQRCGWERFCALGLPTEGMRKLLKSVPEDRGNEAQVDLSLVAIECERSHLIFVDGIYRPELSSLGALPKGALVLPLSEGMKKFGGLVGSKILEGVKKEREPFVALSAAFCEEGAVIYLPPRMHVEMPLQLLFFGGRRIAAPRLHFYLGEGASLSLYGIEQMGEVLSSGLVDVHLEKGAQLRSLVLKRGSKESISLTAWRGVLKEESSFDLLYLTEGGHCVRESARLHLRGEGCKANLKGMYVLKGQRDAHFSATMHHAAPHTHSLQKFKAVLHEMSRLHFEGKILVDNNALKTEAYQLIRTLLLSDGATVHVKPTLEIFADDVKASHGATTGQLSEEDLFYLQARGLSFSAAQEILLHSFCREMLDEIASPHMLKAALTLL